MRNGTFLLDGIIEPLSWCREAIVQENPLQCAKTFYSLLGNTPRHRSRVILRTCIRIRIRVKSRIRIRIKVKIQELQRLKMEPYRTVEVWRLKIKPL
jgi:hypothetical protein